MGREIASPRPIPEVASDEVSPRKVKYWTGAQISLVAVLFLANVCNYVDRSIISILQEPIKRELHLSDLQLGWINGPAFALLYTLAGLPIARWAERTSRPKILAIACGVWSMSSAACGLTVNFAQLVAARAFVGLGESACGPVSYAMVADSFRARQRGLAMAMMTGSVSIAAFFGPAVAGLISERWGWRVAFAAVSVPGLLLSLLVYVAVRDPRPPGALETSTQRSRLADDVKLLLTKPEYVYFLLGSIFLGVGIGGVSAFTASYFVRQFGMSVAQAGVIAGLVFGAAGVFGNFAGGYIADRFAGTHGRSYVLTPAAGGALAGIFFLAAFTVADWRVAVPLMMLANLATTLKSGPIQAAAQNMSPPHMRATTAAVTMLGITLLGTALGPMLVGAVSETVASAHFPGAMGRFQDACPGGHALGTVGPAVRSACRMASSEGLRMGLVAASSVFLVSTVMMCRSAAAMRKPLAE